MARIHRRGRRGEALVAAYLTGCGWSVLDRNWRFHHKELDLVVARDGAVAFVEVKTRSEDGLGHPLESITARKRRDLATAARGWIARHGADHHTFRFDAATVVTGPAGTRVEHVEDAWRL
ncbi:MAG: YraN family protein [Candidatus Longimicrobiales bacterium M2_2A_002]